MRLTAEADQFAANVLPIVLELRARRARLWRYRLTVEPAGTSDREGRAMACLDRAEPACPVAGQ